jgi:hypothetical protein
MTAIRSRVRLKRRGRLWPQSARKRACWSQTELAVCINLRQVQVQVQVQGLAARFSVPMEMLAD